MIILTPKGIGKPDYSSEVGVSTSPVVIRHQATHGAGTYYFLDIDTGFDTAIMGSTSMYIPPTIPEHTLYITSFTLGYSKNVKFEYIIGIIDLDRAIEANILGLSGEEAVKYMFKEIYLRGFAEGSVNIRLPLSVPIVGKFTYKYNEPSTYLPSLWKYQVGMVMIQKTDENLKGSYINMYLAGITDLYPWWM